MAPLRFQRPLMTRTPTTEFYFPEHPRYRCCCQWCHVRTGSMAISIICMFICLYFVIKGVVFIVRYPEEYSVSSVIAVVTAVVCCFISVLLLIGVWKEKPLLLVPYLIVQALVIFVTFAMAVVCIIYLFTGDSSLLGPTDAVEPAAYPVTSQEDGWVLKLFVIGAAVVYSLAFGFGIWFFIVVVQCFRWMKDRKAHNMEKDFSVPLSGISPYHPA